MEEPPFLALLLAVGAFILAWKLLVWLLLIGGFRLGP